MLCQVKNWKKVYKLSQKITRQMKDQSNNNIAHLRCVRLQAYKLNW